MCQQSLWRADDDQTQVYAAGGGARAIDVAKRRNEVLIDAVRGGYRRRMTILNTRADHDKLIASTGDAKGGRRRP
jgi:hypothetical protein